MNEPRPQYDDEIDLIELFMTLWNGKWIIILCTVLVTALGGTYAIVGMQNSYRATVPLYKAGSDAFSKYTTLNELLRQNGFSYQISSDDLFEKFVAEFQDYDEVVEILSSVENLADDPQLSDVSAHRLSMHLQKKFELVAPSDAASPWQLKFEWRSAAEAKDVSKQILKVVLDNAKRDSLIDLEALIATLKDRTRLQMANTKNEQDTLKQAIQLDNQKRLLFLAEQSEIARELGIEKNGLDASSLAQSQTSGFSLSVNATEVPFYLRGYRAIDKEISLIRNRTDEQNFALNGQYVQLQKQLNALERDIATSQLETEISVFANDDPTNWVHYNVDFAAAKSTKRTSLYLAVFVMLGGFLGLVIVLVRSALANRKMRLV